MELLIVFSLPLVLALLAYRWGYDSRDSWKDVERNRAMLRLYQHHHL
jgi:hypothetical protein